MRLSSALKSSVVVSTGQRFHSAVKTPQHKYDEVTEVSRVADSCLFQTTITDKFSIGGAPNGGYLMGLAMNAARQCVQHADPLSATGYYINKTDEHKLMDIHVEILSNSKSTSTVSVKCLQQNDLKVKFTITYGILGKMKGLTKIDMVAPDLPPISECVDAMSLLRKKMGSFLTIAHQVELRVPKEDEFAKTLLAGQRGDTAAVNGWGGFAGDRPLCLSSLCLLADCYPPPVLNVAQFAWVPTLEYTVHFWTHPPSLDLDTAIISANNETCNSSHTGGSNSSRSRSTRSESTSAASTTTELSADTNSDVTKHWIRYKAATTFVQNGMLFTDNEIWSECGRYLLATSRQLARVMMPKT